MRRPQWKRLSSDEVHQALIRRWWRQDGMSPNGETERQAEFCPYWVKLSGQLGYDWGVQVNPESGKFGEVVFEHDDCGCPEGSHPHREFGRDAWLDRKTRLVWPVDADTVTPGADLSRQDAGTT